MQADIPVGIPTLSDYERVKRSELFTELETHSRNFLADHPVVQQSYGWVHDPLHQWSRQWEYPFVYENIQVELRKRTDVPVDVLDAGSGATFFPFLLQDKLQGGSVTCCDYDESLQAIFDVVNESRQQAVHFRQGDLRQLPFADASFDILYCVSVLEHTENYEEIVNEFFRVLRPGGLMLATFDIGLDGISDISPEEAARLNDYINSRFGGIDTSSGPLRITAESITSRQIGEQHPELLPWRYPFLSWLKTAFKRRRLPTQMSKNLTVLCARYLKPS